jgi:hypothetical protein
LAEACVRVARLLSEGSCCQYRLVSW